MPAGRRSHRPPATSPARPDLLAPVVVLKLQSQQLLPQVGHKGAEGGQAQLAPTVGAKEGVHEAIQVATARRHKGTQARGAAWNGRTPGACKSVWRQRQGGADRQEGETTFWEWAERWLCA